MASFIFLQGMFPLQYETHCRKGDKWKIRQWDTMFDDGIPYQAVIAKGNIIEGVEAKT